MEEGGETSLPLARAIDEERQKLPNPSECAAKLGIAVPPRRGDALMFFDLDPMGRQGQRAALHASCPTLKVRGWRAEGVGAGGGGSGAGEDVQGVSGRLVGCVHRRQCQTRVEFGAYALSLLSLGCLG